MTVSSAESAAGTGRPPPSRSYDVASGTAESSVPVVAWFGLCEDNWTDLGECKWGPVRSPEAVVRELEAKVKEFPNRLGATIGRRIFSRQRPRGPRSSRGCGGMGWRRCNGDGREGSHRAGYARKPVEPGEFDAWDDEQVWPE